jgi:hypothetical protein
MQLHGILKHAGLRTASSKPRDANDQCLVSMTDFLEFVQDIWWNSKLRRLHET